MPDDPNKTTTSSIINSNTVTMQFESYETQIRLLKSCQTDHNIYFYQLSWHAFEAGGVSHFVQPGKQKACNRIVGLPAHRKQWGCNSKDVHTTKQTETSHWPCHLFRFSIATRPRSWQHFPLRTSGRRRTRPCRMPARSARPYPVWGGGRFKLKINLSVYFSIWVDFEG